MRKKHRKITEFREARHDSSKAMRGNFFHMHVESWSHGSCTSDKIIDPWKCMEDAAHASARFLRKNVQSQELSHAKTQRVGQLLNFESL